MLTFILPVLESAINRLIEQDPKTHQAITELDQKTFSLNITDLNLKMFMHIRQHSVCLYSHWDEKVDTAISGKLLGLMGTALQRGDTSALFDHSVTISGNLKAGETIKNILSQIDIDWEHLLAQKVGGPLACQLSKTGSKARAFIKARSHSLKNQLQDYLHKEITVGVNAQQVKDFKNDVHTIRMATERLEAKLQQLKNKRL
jgi:ubiquinone biosynthesis accessory factor UbiJ